MTSSLALRTTPANTTADLKDQMRSEESDLITETIPLHDLSFHLDGADVASVKIGKKEVPVGTKGIQAFGDFVGIPSPFFKRVGKEWGLDAQQYLLEKAYTAYPGSAVTIKHGEAQVAGVFEPGREPLDPTRLITVAEKVLGTSEGVVQRVVNDPGEFSFDVHVPFNYDRGLGGDPDHLLDLPEGLETRAWIEPARGGNGKQVGDVTAGGLRLGVDLKRGLAPWVQPWMMRLICTNGMETTDPGLKVDARGQSVDDVLAEVEAMAQRAFSRVESQIEHFYRLREQKVANPERAIRAIARERGIPNRSMTALMDLAAGEGLPDDPSMFDVVNLVTNLANDPRVRNDGGRLLLERAGGAVINDEAARCGHCLQKVS
jgi:hypothetical protein